MIKRSIFRVISWSILLIVLTTIPSIHTQTVVHRLDSNPYNPEVDPDIDMYMAHWKDSPAYSTHGSLVERDVLSKGNPAKPERKGAVLKYVNRFTHASLYAGVSTQLDTLSGEQEILYVVSGKGTISSQKTTADLYRGIFVLIPENCPFTMTNTGDEPLNMYLIAEPVVRDDFIPQQDIVVVDENTIPILTTTGHWSMIIKQAFNIDKELSIIQYVNTITFDPMTIGHPHAHLEGCEEVWTCVDGTSILFLGKEIRMQTPGIAYLCPPYGTCVHSNINHTDKPVKLLYFAVRKDWEKNDGIKRSRE
ncbi:MAG: cupin domain-containing protein [Candidatus Latescibacteria bacterium]|nr:cupin domain-containing protein [Candidatus Latescibacterota bacterium]